MGFVSFGTNDAIGDISLRMWCDVRDVGSDEQGNALKEPGDCHIEANLVSGFTLYAEGKTPEQARYAFVGALFGWPGITRTPIAWHNDEGRMVHDVGTDYGFRAFQEHLEET